jgi:hypothetical protein
MELSILSVETQNPNPGGEIMEKLQVTRIELNGRHIPAQRCACCRIIFSPDEELVLVDLPKAAHHFMFGREHKDVFVCVGCMDGGLDGIKSRFQQCVLSRVAGNRQYAKDEIRAAEARLEKYAQLESLAKNMGIEEVKAPDPIRLVRFEEGVDDIPF